MSEYQVLYSQEELKQIELSIARQMNLSLDQQIHNSILAKLYSLFGELNFSQLEDLVDKVQTLPQQLVLCELFWHLDMQHKAEINNLAESITIKDEMIAQLTLSESTLKETISHANQQIFLKQRDNLELCKQIFKLNEHCYTQQEALLNQQQQISKLAALLDKKQLDLKQKQLELHDADENWSRCQKQYQDKLNSAQTEINSFYELMCTFHQELESQIESKKVNLTTFAIEAEQISLNHQEAVAFYKRAQKFQCQSKNAIALIDKLQHSLITYQLQELNFCLKKVQKPYQHLVRHLIQYQTQISKLRQVLQTKIAIKIAIDKDLSSKLKSCMQSLSESKIKEAEYQQHQKQSKNKIELLQKTMHHLTESNYRILLDLQQNKSKVQDSYFKEYELTKTLNLELGFMAKLNQQTKCKLQSTEFELIIQRQLNEQLKKKLKNHQIKYDQLQQIYFNLKKSINEQLSLYAKDQNTQMQLVQNLIQKNQDLMKQLASAKSKLNCLNGEKEASCQLKQTLRKELIEKMETVSFTLNTNKILNEENQKLQNQLTQRQAQMATLKQKIEELQKLTTLLKDQGPKPQQKLVVSQVQQQAQTYTKTRQSQIKKQKLANQLNSEHSQTFFEISDDEQLKQNVPSSLNRSNNQKFKYRSHAETSQTKPCNHFQKIAALNQIINYLMNYIKGYTGRSVRPNSWLQSRIAKYGYEYEAKLFDETSMQAKLKNLKRVEDICGKEPLCGKLINEFQSIMDFYFQQRSDVLREKSLNGTIAKSRLSSTANKCHFYDKTAIIYSRVHN